MAIWIRAKQHLPSRIRTPYPSERECAHAMIDNKKFKRFKMIHAFVIDKKGRLYRNAFLMKGDEVFDGVTKKMTTFTSFKKRKNIIAAYRYSLREVMYYMRALGRYGRWE